MFRRRSPDEQASTTTVLEDQARDPQAPKGRPTPKRNEAQGQRRTRATVPTDRKAAGKQAREARRAEMAKQREALAGGDERYLPARDKGPVRKFVRDHVDSRYRVAEFFLPLAVVILVLSMIQNTQLRNLSLLLWMVVIVLILVDSVITVILLRKQLRTRFPDKNLRGAVAYALMRTLQMRRLRLPKPMVKRGVKL
ncbi:DUF3043 domain-containing protein [Streptomyces sp. H10-C2]|uniref:DUF3043 domain-containing protein n=1 Tax=unclassified Streptomyces TaxID=2593676 RepID=UPI0024BB6E5B|nr:MULTISPECIES: DUF3043 domain-containing protein [unclassified Streptomyces]MDJ0341163.1 DUF3043 domain-containing protein [Streptomyces sp. PH10-H1]MDJ0369485.1 DUF3043 domain-containing protein [Streptomyces sp. H10-C2]